MPSTETSPASRPCSTLRVTMYRTAGPGVSSSATAAPTNSVRCEKSGMSGPRALVDHHPVDAEAIAALSEPRGEKRLLHLHEDFAAVRQRLENAFGFRIALDAKRQV